MCEVWCARVKYCFCGRLVSAVLFDLLRDGAGGCFESAEGGEKDNLFEQVDVGALLGGKAKRNVSPFPVSFVCMLSPHVYNWFVSKPTTRRTLVQRNEKAPDQG